MAELNGNSWSQAGARPVALRTRVNVRMIVIGVLCVCLGGLGAAFAWATTSKTTAVLILQADVAQGELIPGSAVGIVDVALSPGMVYVPSENLGEINGSYALSDLKAGSLLVPGSYGQPAIDLGLSQLGLRVTYGRLPTGPLPVGTRLLLIQLPRDSDDTETGSFRAVVVSPPERLPDATSFTLDIAVEPSLAARVAMLAAADRIAIVREGER